jgi:3-hydroxymyristoyl/3-hydroxydecanoyl-(acyl carrier protein) dehydratase
MRFDVHGSVAAGHPALAGHFPGDPIVPGALILCRVLEAAREAIGAHFVPVSIPLARFHAPLRPGEDFVCAIERVDATTFKFRVRRGSDLVASGTMRAQPRAPRAVP